MDYSRHHRSTSSKPPRNGNTVFIFTLFSTVAFYLLTLSDLAAILSLIASSIYLLTFFPSFITRASHPDDAIFPNELSFLDAAEAALSSEEDEEIVRAVLKGEIQSYSLESKLGDCKRAAAVRRLWVQRVTGRSLQGLPLERFDYDYILGRCCESPVGYVQIPVGIAGPLLLDGSEYMVPLATTEGCLVASMNRGCKAILLSGGAQSRVYRDGMTRAPVVKFVSAVGACDLLRYLENRGNFDALGNLCSDKKSAAVNWVLGRGKSVVCEAVIKEDVVKKVLKRNVSKLVQLHQNKIFVGSAMAGTLGGYNAHASNIVSAIFIATGQDPAQNVESSQCLTNIVSINDGRDIHASVTMPCIEVGTVGGGTQLASQSACLNLLGVKGASQGSLGLNSRLLATIIAGSVLAGELSLLSAMVTGDMVKSHMKYNRSSKNIANAGRL